MRTLNELYALGWGALVVWQCELQEWDLLWDRILTFLESQGEFP